MSSVTVVSPPPREHSQRWSSVVQRHARVFRAEAVTALDDLLGALSLAGVVLPSLGVDQVPVFGSGVCLVELGRARPDVVAQLAVVIRRGADAQTSQSGAEAV
ncbi:hypothetical protein [Kitasatospora sp. GP82]|uniref:hypothetical protein n=1 Tax=Kitasatospora sp. GP82 TaxID=3035089 RepID=UPI002475A091|nr:hypothetical protein [Kitasatospora sp. GP82]MDH6130425.1 hypothetical protein [Kitasatospora sp. GP82]